MPDDLRTRIAAVQRAHQQGQEWGIPTDECGCGWSSRGEIDYADHLADAVIRELGWQYVIDYCEQQAAVGWREVGTADEAMGRNIVAEAVLAILQGAAEPPLDKRGQRW